MSDSQQRGDGRERDDAEAGRERADSRDTPRAIARRTIRRHSVNRLERNGRGLRYDPRRFDVTSALRTASCGGVDRDAGPADRVGGDAHPSIERTEAAGDFRYTVRVV